MNTRPHLSALSVPWMISPSESAIRINFDEVDHRAVVIFGINLGLHAKPNPTRWVPTVEMLFDPCYELRVTLVRDDAYPLADRRDEFDLSSVETDSSEDLEASLERFKAQWRDTGVCPSPSAYEVLGSPWCTKFSDPGLRHILLVGREVLVDVLTTNWSWRQLPRPDE
jgi:hypothetical protein